MRIGAGFQAYSELGNYNRRVIPQVSVEDVKRQDAKKLAQELQAEQTSDSIKSPDENILRAPKVANLEDVSLSFKDNELNTIGRDSDIFGLDVQKAVSDMKKDSILEEYQVFVGSGNTNNFNNEDGVVIPKLNIQNLL